MEREPLKPIRLSTEMRTVLQDMEADLRTLDFELAKAKRAGLDIGDMEKRLVETKKLRTGLLKEYS